MRIPAVRVWVSAALVLPVLPAMATERASPALCVTVVANTAAPDYLECLSAELSAGLSGAEDTRLALDASARSRQPREPAEQGLYTQTATRLRLGANFGRSVVPYRPVLDYRNPLLTPVQAPQ